MVLDFRLWLSWRRVHSTRFEKIINITNGLPRTRVMTFRSLQAENRAERAKANDKDNAEEKVPGLSLSPVK